MTTHVTIKNHGPHNIEIATVELADDEETRLILNYYNLEPEEDITLYLWKEHSLEIREAENKGLTHH